MGKRSTFFLHVVLLMILLVMPMIVRAQNGTEERTLIHDGITRVYRLHVPLTYDPSTPSPLVLALHGGGGNAAQFEDQTGFSEKADAEGFIVVYPQGTGRTQLYTWNAVHCCAYALENQVDDVGFIDALIDALAAEYNIDPLQIFATGHSNGGMMSYRLGAELSDRISAIAVSSGTIGGRIRQRGNDILIPEPSQPVSVLAIHGMLDENVHYEGGSSDGPLTGRIDLSVAESIAFWVAADGCDPTPVETVSESGNVTVTTYSGCEDATAVELVSIADHAHAHAWAGAEPEPRRDVFPTQEVSATDLIWEFFTRSASNPN